MTSNPRQIEALVMRAQNAFLTAPSLALSLEEAQRRFRLDGVVCEAVLSALVDMGVLARTREGAYVRAYPKGAPGASRAA